jgi:hypothetical protein
MRSLEWKELAELMGIAAIVASLIFVGLQLKQDQVIGRYESATDYDDTMIAYSGAIIENADLWYKGIMGAEFDDPADEVRFQALAYMAHRKFAGIYRRNRLLSSGYSIDDVAHQFANELFIFPGLKRVFLERCKKQNSMGLTPIFCDHVRDKLRLIESGEVSAPDGEIYIP